MQYNIGSQQDHGTSQLWLAVDRMIRPCFGNHGLDECQYPGETFTMDFLSCLPPYCWLSAGYIIQLFRVCS